jgi:lipopolysaccharide export system permease protein
MKVMDRYIAWTFYKIFAICLVCLTGLFIIVDVFSNLEEFVELGQKSGGLLSVLIAYYAPRMLQLFDRCTALMALTAAIATLVWMQRYNELAAIEAGGIAKSRVVRPILMSMLVLIGLSLINRELIIPRHRESLARNAQSWDGGQARSLTPQQDQNSGIWIINGKVTPGEGKIEQAQFRLPKTCGELSGTVFADKAQRLAEDELHPAGFLLSKVRQPADLPEKPSVVVDAQPLVLTPREHKWLSRDELFIRCGVVLNDLAFSQELRRFSSLSQQIGDMQNPSVWTSSRQRVELHSRMVRPAQDFAFLLIGIPLVLTRRDRNVFMALGVCLVTVMGIQMFIWTCQGLGASHIIPSASLAAWLPIMLLLPCGFAMHARLDN